MARRADPQFHVFGFDEPVPSSEARARNGVYRGTATVRHLPPGVFGTELRRALHTRLARGQVWIRGEQRVRVTRFTNESVWFRELSHGRALRRLARWQFISTGRPEKRQRPAASSRRGESECEF
jgi:hypothetical protein